MSKAVIRPNPWDAYQSSLRKQGYLARALLAVSLVAALVLGSSTSFAWLGREHMRNVLIQNASAAINATCHAVNELIDIDLVCSFCQDPGAISQSEGYRETMADIRGLRDSVGAERVYVVIQAAGEHLAIWDTAADGQPHGPYGLSPLQDEAFCGRQMLDVHDPGDSSASINEGALPLYSDDDVVAIVCVEFSSRYANDAYNTAALNTNLLIGSLAVMMAVLFAVSVALARMNQRNQQHLFDMANKDVITGLPNRRYLFSYLADLFGQASPRQPDSPVVALFIDIDNFKAVNDGAGHDVGDHLLASIGGFLAEALSQVAMSTRHECLTARLGGDEFVQLLVGADMELATTYVCMLMERFSLTPDLLEYIGPYDVSLSIGIAACPEHATEFNDLVKFADIAMYHSKAQGKHSYTVYDPDMGHHVEGYTLSVREVRK